MNPSSLDEVRRHFELTFEPGSGRFAGATDTQISPDGTSVAFTGTICDDLDVGTYTRIGLVRAGVAARLSDGPHDDHTPRWSPDGRTIAFLSDRLRAGFPQLVLADLEAGTFRDTPPTGGIIEYFSWAPDGASILLGVAGVDADQGDRRGPGLQQAALECGDRPHADWEPSVWSADLDGHRRGLFVYSRTSERIETIGPPDWNVWEAAWCGSAGLVCVASRGVSEGAWFSTELRWSDVSGGGGRTLLASGDQFGRPRGSPSGRLAAVIRGLCSDRGVVPGDLFVIDPATGQALQACTDGVDVTDITWLSDEELGFIGLRGSEVVAGIVRGMEPTAKAEIVWKAPSSGGRHIPTASFSPDRMAHVVDRYDTYAEIVVVDRRGATEIISLAPSSVTELVETGGSCQAISWASPDGTEIGGWLTVPPGSGPHPLVLHVHGGPVGATMNAWSMGNDTTRLLTTRGYAVLHPNPRGSFGRGQDFVRAVLGDMGGQDAADLLSGVDAVVATGIVQEGQVAVIGTSYGGFMASLLPTRDDRFVAAVAMSPVTDWESFALTSNIPEFADLFLQVGTPAAVRIRREHSPLTWAPRNRTPTLLVAGLLDRCTPPEQATRFFDALAGSGTEARLVTYPQAGHGVQHLPAIIDLIARVVDWLDEHMNRPAYD